MAGNALIPDFIRLPSAYANTWCPQTPGNSFDTLRFDITRPLLDNYSPKPIQTESFSPFFCFRYVERNSTFRIYSSIHTKTNGRRVQREWRKKMKRGEYRFSRVTLEEFLLTSIEEFEDIFETFPSQILHVCLRLRLT